MLLPPWASVSSEWQCLDCDALFYLHNAGFVPLPFLSRPQGSQHIVDLPALLSLISTAATGTTPIIDAATGDLTTQYVEPLASCGLPAGLAKAAYDGLWGVEGGVCIAAMVPFYTSACLLANKNSADSKKLHHQATTLNINEEAIIAEPAGARADVGLPKRVDPTNLSELARKLSLLLDLFLAMHPGARADQPNPRHARARPLTLGGIIESCLSMVKARLNRRGPGTPTLAKKLAGEIDALLKDFAAAVLNAAESLASRHPGHSHMAWLPEEDPLCSDKVWDDLRAEARSQLPLLLARLYSWNPEEPVKSSGGTRA